MLFTISRLRPDFVLYISVAISHMLRWCIIIDLPFLSKSVEKYLDTILNPFVPNAPFQYPLKT